MDTPGRLERYALVALVDRGGMGSVYRARDERLDREVALKILRDSGDTEAHARVLREARAVAALEHPNVVAIFDVGEALEEGATTPTLFIAMELVRGESLRSLIGRSTVSLAERVRWMRDVADALGFAHERGIIHRDVKPENVMIRSDGVVKVLDFGIARRKAVEASPALPTLTEKGMVLGTPRYMAPEQMLGAELDGRADQFAWGVVAYEVLAGSLPWTGEAGSLQAVAEMLMTPHTPLRERAPSVPAEIASVVERAMSRARRDRFKSMREIVSALDAWLSSAGIFTTGRRTTATLTARRRKKGPWVAASVGTLAVLAIVVAARMRVHSAPMASPPPAASANASCSARACTAMAHAASVCRADGRCAPLASEDCHVASEEADVGDDRTLWVGAMYPLSGPDADAFGTREFRAVDLARRELARVMSGTNSGASARPIGLVACDDAVDPRRAARHLVDDVGAPAVIGFRTSQEAIDVATSTFLPRGVLVMSALNTSPMLTRLPRAPGQPRLVWRTAVSSTASAGAAATVVPDVLEPLVRAAVLGVKDAMRVALVRQDDPAGSGFAEAFFRALRFNGRAAVDNGASFEEVLFPFESSAPGAAFEKAAEKTAAFAPHVIVYFGADETFARVLAPLEARWPPRVPRPRYLKPAALGPAIVSFVARDGERRRRFLGMTSTSSSVANVRFVTRFNAAYEEHATRAFSPNSSYDAFYLLAYATYASEPGAGVTGLTLARALTRLVPPGEPVDVGPEGIFPTLDAFAAGKNVDLNGATGRLDFDLATGEAPVDFAILCLGVDAKGAATEGVESGLIFDAKSRALSGALVCP